MKCSSMLASILAIVLSSAGAQPSQYRVICLDCAVGTPLQPTGINASGVIVANSTRRGHGYILHHDFATPIPALDGGKHNGVNGINDAGVVVGQSSGVWNGLVGFFGYSWDGVTLTDLGDPINIDGNYYWSSATAVNNAGQVAGNAQVATHWRTAFFYSDGTMKRIQFPGADETHANGLNSYGRVVGGASADTRHAWTWKSGVLTDLEGTFEESEAYAINDHDQVAGYGVVYDPQTFSTTWYGVVWNDTTPILLPFPPGHDGVIEARGITNHGWVVGFACELSDEDHCAAFLFDGTTNYDLNTLLDSSGAGWRLTRAVAINESNQIIGTGWLNGHRQAYVATPIK